MNPSLGERFATALQRMEQTREVEALAALFSDQATLRRIPQLHTYCGHDDVRTFWRHYVGFFAEIETTFTNLLDLGDRAVLEWCSRGRLRNGHPVAYEGVSIVEADDDGRVICFRTYYDADAATGAQPAAFRKALEARP
jgi:hypothetical protein